MTAQNEEVGNLENDLGFIDAQIDDHEEQLSALYDDRQRVLRELEYAREQDEFADTGDDS